MTFRQKKNIQHALKKYCLNIFVYITLLVSALVHANESYQLPIAGDYIFTAGLNNTVIAIGKDKNCIIKNLTAAIGSDPRLSPRLSNDGEYVILSEHDYIAKNELISCTKQAKVTSIKSILFDINKAKGLVLSADIYSTSPHGYLAEVYDTKSKKEAIIAKGFFDKRKSIKNSSTMYSA
ncbi:hypothetical protein ACFOLG_01925 [Vogesella facilis]|uniref:Uncharacterized protein n=1 Tax=Vogesella facilis TaxID=1655232 RepID=A0ABV7RC10_9NEIS